MYRRIYCPFEEEYQNLLQLGEEGGRRDPGLLLDEKGPLQPPQEYLKARKSISKIRLRNIHYMSKFIENEKLWKKSMLKVSIDELLDLLPQDFLTLPKEFQRKLMPSIQKRETCCEKYNELSLEFKRSFESYVSLHFKVVETTIVVKCIYEEVKLLQKNKHLTFTLASSLKSKLATTKSWASKLRLEKKEVKDRTAKLQRKLRKVVEEITEIDSLLQKYIKKPRRAIITL